MRSDEFRDYCRELDKAAELTQENADLREEQATLLRLMANLEAEALS